MPRVHVCMYLPTKTDLVAPHFRKHKRTKKLTRCPLPYSSLPVVAHTSPWPTLSLSLSLPPLPQLLGKTRRDLTHIYWVSSSPTGLA